MSIERRRRYGQEAPALRSRALFERFNERARQVVVLAQDEARALHHNYIGTEHILLGLCKEDGHAARVLESLDITVEEVRPLVARIVGQGDEVTTGQIPFTPRAKKVFDLALREALSLGHNYIDTEHILLGLVRENDGVAARILLDLDADAEKIRNAVIERLSVGWKRAGSGTVAATSAKDAPVPSWRLAWLATALEEAKRALIERQQFDAAARLHANQRRLARIVEDLEAELTANGLPLEPPSLRDPAARRWQYEVKPLAGGPDGWPEQLAAWRMEGWELLTIVRDGEQHVAVLERRV